MPFFYFRPVKYPYVTPTALDRFIVQALQEDMGDGDHSTLAVVPDSAQDCAIVLMKDSGIIAGMTLAERIFKHLDPEMQIEAFVVDGDQVEKGKVLMRLQGKAQALLSGERLMLNCLQRMSGIATLTRQAADLVADLPVQVLDTRKTTPNFRMLEKWAVAIGGGTNHRFGLSDMVMLKDNHIDFAGGIRPAILAAKAYLAKNGKNLAIEIETQDLDQVTEVLQVGQVDVVMLDNMSLEDMAKAVKMIGGRFKTEASGGVTLENLRQIAQTGVDYISMGALTHSAKSLDISMKSCAYFNSLTHN